MVNLGVISFTVLQFIGACLGFGAASVKLSPEFMAYKRKYHASLRPKDKDELPWWHKNSKARRNEQDVFKRTCGKDCTGHLISPICVGVRRQKGVFHQFWSTCELRNYMKCNKGVAKHFFFTGSPFCRGTAPSECTRRCVPNKRRPVCATGDPENDDYAYANLCYFRVARCVARVNRGVNLRVRAFKTCPRKNPHRFPSQFHRLWFIKTV